MVFGLFSKERALKRAIAKANNKNAQSPDRWAAMEKLKANGTDEALFGLCRRFTFACDKMIEDEQEKEWVCETLIGKGEMAVGPVRRWLKNAPTVSYGLRVLGAIAGADTVLATIDAMLEDEEPGYTRDPSRRIQIITWLGEWQGGSDDAVVQRVAPYLADFDETCRFAAADAISLHAKAAESAGKALLDALLRPEEESRRLKVRLAEVLAEAEIDLGERKSEVSPLLDDLLSAFQMHRDRLVQRKGK